MSLLLNSFEDFVVVTKEEHTDGYGGNITEWVESEIIKCSVVLTSTNQKVVGMSVNPEEKYTITTTKI